MVTHDDIESFLLRLEQPVEEVEPGMWVLGSDGSRVVVHHSPPLLLLRTRVLEIPQEDTRCTELFRKLLELNATDLVHGSYGIEEGDIILSDTLELEHLDFNTLQSSVESLQLAIASHREALSPFRAC
jgi:hypothetical protein